MLGRVEFSDASLFLLLDRPAGASY